MSSHPRINIQNQSPESIKEKSETLAKRFLKKMQSFEIIRNLHPVIQESSSKNHHPGIDIQNRNSEPTKKRAKR